MSEIPVPKWLLSHALDEHTPTWRDNPSVLVSPYSQITAGDVCNQTIVSTLTHNGTHVDAAFHFDGTGRSITDYSVDFWMFRRPIVLDLAKNDNELITAAEILARYDQFEDADLLLLRTGFERFRADRTRFGTRSPGFAADAAPALRAMPKLRAVGMDIPSATAPASLEEGIAFHRHALLDQVAPSGSRGLVLIEDMRLAQELSLLSWVLVAPFYLRNGDGAQVTVFAG